MLIVSEISEALEAKRKLPDLNLNTPEEIQYAVSMQNFPSVIKNSFEDEIADVYIRLIDYIGFLIKSEGMPNDAQNAQFEFISQAAVDILDADIANWHTWRNHPISDKIVRVFTNSDNVGALLFELTKLVISLSDNVKYYNESLQLPTYTLANAANDRMNQFVEVVWAIITLFNKFKSPTNTLTFEDHVTLKMDYNATRPKKHGAKF